MVHLDPDNPWLQIPAADYEGHMGPEVADQLAPLSRLFGQVYRRLRPAAVALLGCTTGNGLEHVDPGLTGTVAGIDINPHYLEITRQRHGRRLGSALQLHCLAAESWQPPGGSFDLVHAALLFEYVDPGLVLPRVASALHPTGVFSAVLQLPSPSPMVTPTPYPSLEQLAPVMRLVPPPQLEATGRDAGLQLVEAQTEQLSSGKQLWFGMFGPTSRSAP